MEKINKKLAKELNLDFYYVKVCKNGHTCGRYVTTGKCIECEHPSKREAFKKWRNENETNRTEI